MRLKPTPAPPDGRLSLLGGASIPNPQWQQVNILEWQQLISPQSVEPTVAAIDRPGTAQTALHSGTEPVRFVQVGVGNGSLDFAVLVRANYRYLEAAIGNGKFLRVLLRLTARDIATLDYTMPVRLQSDHVRYGETVTGYFYLCFIDQYLAGANGSCWVELMRIELPQLTSATVTVRDDGGYLLLPDGVAGQDGYFLQPDGGRLRLPG